MQASLELFDDTEREWVPSVSRRAKKSTPTRFPHQTVPCDIPQVVSAPTKTITVSDEETSQRLQSAAHIMARGAARATQTINQAKSISPESKK